MNNFTDAIIVNPNDELYDLQKRYNVKISRSNSSDAVYIFRNKNFKIRIGHPIGNNKNHLRNFRINKEYKTAITKDIVENVIKMYNHKL